MEATKEAIEAAAEALGRENLNLGVRESRRYAEAALTAALPLCERGDRRSSFHLHNGYPHNTEARNRIRELIEWYGGGVSSTPGQIEAVLAALKTFRPEGNAPSPAPAPADESAPTDEMVMAGAAVLRANSENSAEYRARAVYNVMQSARPLPPPPPQGE